VIHCDGGGLELPAGVDAVVSVPSHGGRIAVAGRVAMDARAAPSISGREGQGRGRREGQGRGRREGQGRGRCGRSSAAHADRDWTGRRSVAVPVPS